MSKMTYEQAVATALLKALGNVQAVYELAGWSWPCVSNYNDRMYAVRRLRVRAGLAP